VIDVRELTERLERLAEEMDGGWSVEVHDDCARVLVNGAYALCFVMGDDPSSGIYVRAEVADVSDLLEDAYFLEDVLKANFFWEETEGATLSLSEGRLFLADRRDAVFFEEPEALAEFVDGFVELIFHWRDRLPLYRSPDGVEGKSGKEAL